MLSRTDLSPKLLRPIQARLWNNPSAAAFRYLQKMRHIPPKKIVIFWWPIGSGVATQLAMNEPDAGGPISLNPNTSVSDVGVNASWRFRFVLRPAQWRTNRKPCTRSGGWPR